MKFSGLNCQCQYIILHINVNMYTIVAILSFMSRINLRLSRVEHEKKYDLGARVSKKYKRNHGITDFCIHFMLLCQILQAVIVIEQGVVLIVKLSCPS